MSYMISVRDYSIGMQLLEPVHDNRTKGPHAIVDPRSTKEACVWLLPVLVVSPAIDIGKHELAKKSKVGTPVVKNYGEDKRHA